MRIFIIGGRMSTCSAMWSDSASSCAIWCCARVSACKMFTGYQNILYIPPQNTIYAHPTHPKDIYRMSDLLSILPQNTIYTCTHPAYLEKIHRASECLFFSPHDTKHTCAHLIYLEDVHRMSEFPLYFTTEYHTYMRLPFIPG